MTFLQAVLPGYLFQLLKASEVPIRGRYATMQALGMKLLPTKELVEALTRISDRAYPLRVAVLNAGDGVLADLADLTAYDRYRDATLKNSSRTANGLVPPAYGRNVIKVDILEESLKDYNKVLVGLFIPSRNEPSENAYSSPDEVYMMERVWMYIHIGDELISSFKVELLKKFKHYRVVDPPLVVWSPKIKPVIDVFINDEHCPSENLKGLEASETMHRLSFL